MSDILATNAYGIDISHWQDITPSLSGLDFLFARATIGTQTDEMYSRHIARAKAAGLVTGAYHFGDIGSAPAAQAKAFLDAAGDVDLYVLDHEAARKMTDAGARAFVAAIQAAGKRCGLYASLSGFPSFGQDYNWIALWASTPPTGRSWTFWQFGGSGVDHDVFNGNAAQLRAFARGETVDIDVTNASPALVDLPVGTKILNLDGTLRTTLTAARVGVLSPFGSTSDGGTALRAVIIGGKPNLLLAAYGNAVTNVRPVDVTPFSQADIDKAVAEKDAQIVSLQGAIDEKVKQAIAADRASAHVGVIYPSA